MPVLAPPPTLVRPPAPMVRAPANYIRPFRSAGGGGGGVKGGGGGGGGGGGRGGGGGWNGWGPEPGNPWWGNPYDSWVMRIGFSLITAGVYVDPTVEQNAADWEAIRDFVKAKAQDLNNLLLDAPATQGRYNSGGFAFIDPTGGSIGLEGASGLMTGAVAIGAGISALLSAGVAGLAQLWGRFNGRKPASYPAELTFEPRPGPAVLRSVCVYGPNFGSQPDGSYLNCSSKSIWSTNRVSVKAVPWQPDPTKVQFIGTITGSDGEPEDFCVAVGNIDGRCLEFDPERFKAVVSDMVAGEWTDTPAAPPYVPEPLPEPMPLVEPLQVPAPLVPLPLSPPTPADPEQVPVSPPVPAAPPEPRPPQLPPQVNPGTAPARRPATRPQAPPVPTPLPVETPTPQAEPTENGALVPAPVPPPVVTPEDAHFVGGQPVRSPGPAPTPEGIAKEVGRIEEKLAMLLDPKKAGGSSNLDRLGELTKLAMDIMNILTGLTGAGAYTMSSPCEVDEAGQRIVTTVNYGAGLTTLGLLNNKVDALAALLQAHKDLKQPICRQLPPVGQPVTVNFVQVD